MNFRALEEKDIPNIEKIYDLYWSGDFRQKLSLRLKEYREKTEKAMNEDVHYFVVEEDEIVLGAISFRKCPAPMMQYAKTSNPMEIYILAVSVQGKGTGRMLLEMASVEAKSIGYTEAVLYNSDSHQESRGFYTRMGFEDFGPAMAPDGEPGRVFRISL